MKKIPLIIIFLLLIFSCDPAAEIDAITEYFNYFLDIEADKTTGTENTEFSFSVNTNDTLTEWIIDGESEAISRGTNEISRSFLPGNHSIGATTENGATDTIEITDTPKRAY